MKCVLNPAAAMLLLMYAAPAVLSWHAADAPSTDDATSSITAADLETFTEEALIHPLPNGRVLVCSQ
jgi:hypothetical protein